MAIKVAFIGAGSIGFTRRLLTDILSVPELRDIDIRFMDIDEENLSMVTRLCER
ncbi:MAG TPA: alpha-glucosidase/alpha-galactosidase, partial [Clostridia bacterium]|nr:alpha-glucosidase/alpha-galactosidase [Clostridia bacterium]